MANTRSSSEHTCTFSRVTIPKFTTPAGALLFLSNQRATPSQATVTGQRFITDNEILDFRRYSTGYWTCRICIRESLEPAYLLSPAMAEVHEKSAYHQHNISRPLYQLQNFSEEENTAWDGPNPVNDTWAWLREQEFKAYNERKSAEWAKQNPDWNKYNPDEDEFLHPHLRDTTKRPRRKVPKNAATRFDFKKQEKKKDQLDDLDSVKGIRGGLGFYLYDPLPKPERDLKKWVSGLKDASRDEDYAPRINWNDKFVTEPNAKPEKPLGAQVTASVFTFGQRYAKYCRMSDKKRESMHLFLELPTVEKVRRIELLAMKLCDPGAWDRVIDQPKYWN